MKKKYLAKTTFAVMMAALLAVPVGGCGNKKDAEEKVTTEVTAKLTEKDLEGVITGLDDHYILENAKNIDFLHGIKYDDGIIKDVKVDNKEVKLSKTGKYTATYTVSVDVDALEKYQEEKAIEKKASSKDKEQSEEKETTKKDSSVSSKNDTENNKQDDENTTEDKKESGKDTNVSESIDDADKEATADKDASDNKEEASADKGTSADKEDSANESNSGSKEDTSENTADKTDQASGKDDTDTSKDESEKNDNTEEVEIDKEIEVVDKETAEDLADKGEVVWTDDNDTVPKTDGTKPEEVVKEPESTASSDKPAASADKDNDKQTSTSKPNNTGNTGNSGNVANTGSGNNNSSNSGNSNSSAPAPSKPAGCSHNWVAQYTKGEAPGHWETVTDYKEIGVIVCDCGQEFTDDHAFEIHSAFECSVGGGYWVRPDKIAIGSHKEWVVDGPAPDILTGYKCSKCGAAK